MDLNDQESSVHILPCLGAANETITFIHSSYLHRPYFRTWWYNCTYLLDATMILLHVLLSSTCPLPIGEIVRNIELSLEVFKAMKALGVARKCAEVVQELLHTATLSTPEGQRRLDDMVAQKNQQLPSVVDSGPRLDALPGHSSDNIDPQQGLSVFDGLLVPEGSETDLVPNLVWNFSDVDNWGVWSAADF